MNYKSLWLCLLWVFFALPLQSQQLAQEPNLVKDTLPNGLTYYIYDTDNIEGEAYFRLFLKVGSLQEKPEERGFAHFLEHMAFNGTEHFKKNDLVSFLESKGARFGTDLNAHTSYNETIYKLKVPTDDSLVVDSTLTILSDWANSISLDSTEIEKERGVVLSEWLSKQGPKKELQKKFLMEILNKSRYAEREVIGDTLVLKNFTKQELKDFYERWYDPVNMAVAIAGDVDKEQVERKIRTNFSTILSDGQRSKQYSIDGYSQPDIKIYTDEWTDDIELSAINLVPPLREIDDEATYQKYLVHTIINELFDERFKNIAHENPAYSGGSVSTGNFFPVKAAHIASTTLKPDSISAGITEYFKNLENIYRYGFTVPEITKVKKVYLNQLKNKAEDTDPPSARLMIEEMHKDFFYGNSIVTKNEEYKLAKKYIADIDSVYLTNRLEDKIPDGNTHFLITANKRYADRLPSKAELENLLKDVREKSLNRYTNPLRIPDRLIETEPQPGTIISENKIPEIGAREIKLANGMRVIYKESDIDENSIVFSGFRKGGFYALDTLNYVNGLFSDPVISASGYGDFSRQELTYFLAGNSAKVLMLPDRKRTGFYASSKTEDIQTLFQLFYLKWTQPRLDSDKFDQIKREIKNGIKNKNITPTKAFQNDLKRVIRGTNYITSELTENDVESKLQKDSILAIYDRFFGSAEGYTVSLVTDLPYDSVKKYIKTYLGGLPGGDVDTDYRYTYKYRINGEVDFIRHNGESPRAMVSLIFQQHELADQPAMTGLKNEIIEEVLKNMLLERLREELGGVYSVGVSVNSTSHPSTLSRQTISFITEEKKVEELIAETQSVLKLVTEGQIDYQDRIEKVKTNLLKNHGEAKQRNSFWTSAIRDHFFKNYQDWNMTVNYEQMLDSITQKELSELARIYFKNTSMIKAILYPKSESNTKPNETSTK